MTDNWDEIENLLKNSKPLEPSEAAKNLAISKAIAEFDKKHAKSFQGISPASRLIDAVRAAFINTIGEFTMRKAYILAGGVCVSLLAVTLMNSTYLSQDLLPKIRGEEQQIFANSGATDLQINVGAGTKKSEWSAPVASPEPASPPAPPPIPALVPQAKPAPTKQEAKGDDLRAFQKMQNKDSTKKLERYGAESNASASVDLPQQPVAMLMPPPPAEQLAYAPPAVARQEMAKTKGLTRAAESDAVISNIGGAPGVAQGMIAPMPDYQPPSYQDEGRDKFQDIKENPTKLVKEEPVSTFSVDVDTSSYSFMRASLNNNVLPQKDAVRIEEMVNYFPYDYEVPKDKSEPFKANVSVFPTPWNPDTKLMHIGIKGYQIEQAEKPHSNLVFLIDTSGSMNDPNKLPLVKNSLKLLLDNLKADDTVAIVTYAGSAGVALEPTKISDKSKIINILDNLGAGGSTAGAQGIKTAYDLAESKFDKNGVNRVILATDGDFNVGITNQEELKSFIERKRDSGVFLSVLGFGRGNYNDALMQTLAQNGNGNAAYIDNLSEARKALVEESSSTLFTIAKDVKIQVEFNPDTVAEYRLIGYETRLLNREDFNNDKIDAGDIGSGHAVTAVYEITPVGSKARLIDESRYQKSAEKVEKKDKSGEYAFVKIRYKLPDSDTSKLITTPVDSKVEYKQISEIPNDAKFATSVVAFAQILRGDSYTKSYSYDDVINLAQAAKGEDKFGYRSEFINMVRLAKSAPALKPEPQSMPLTLPMDIQTQPHPYNNPAT
mgnify:CR=1 FL=1